MRHENENEADSQKPSDPIFVFLPGIKWKF